MISQEKGKLIIEGNGNVPLIEVVGYLNEVNNTYNSIYVLELLIDRIKEVQINIEYTLDLFLSRSFYSRQKERSGIVKDSQGPKTTDVLSILNHWPPTEKRIASFVPKRDKLILKSVVIQSPGWVELFGSLNPLKFIYDVLNFGHEVRKDISYREELDRKMLILKIEKEIQDVKRRELENERLADENRYIREKQNKKLSSGLCELECVTEIRRELKQAGVSEENLNNLVDSFIIKPFKKVLEKYPDSEFLEGAGPTKLLPQPKDNN